ncbi:hypothetical protein V6N13_136146 [Hibiscus sabdariffa]
MTCFRLDFCYKKGEKNEEKGEWAFWGLQKESSWGRQRASARDPPMSFCLVSRESFAFHCHQILFEPLKYISVLKWESFFLAILSQFTEVQMSRYESFRRSALQKSNMRRLLVSITGSQKISLPMTIVVCGIAKMFVGELVEKARMVMTERKESGPIRPCHIREAYRRLKLEGKVPRRSVQRLFR